jgi:aminoglycoside phosphotransferase (APT) family kinase protein
MRRTPRQRSLGGRPAPARMSTYHIGALTAPKTMSEVGSTVPLMDKSADCDSAERRDADVIDRWLNLLDVQWRPTSVLQLAGGRSDAGVFLLDADGRRLVLKVTTSAAWKPQASRELRFYEDLAPILPIRVPELLAATASEAGVCLLMSAHDPSGKASEWSGGRWVEAASRAGQLHRQVEMADPPAWLSRVPEPSHDGIARAVEQWKRLGHRVVADQLPRLLPELTRLLAETRPIIIHGDCHVGNFLLSAEGELVWADWQEVALGAGPEDLALLWQRAEFDGARPPRPEMMRAYSDARETVMDEAFERLVLAAELRLLFLEWPHFLPYGDERQRKTMVERLLDAQRRWGI